MPHPPLRVFYAPRESSPPLKHIFRSPAENQAVAHPLILTSPPCFAVRRGALRKTACEGARNTRSDTRQVDWSQLPPAFCLVVRFPCANAAPSRIVFPEIRYQIVCFSRLRTNDAAQKAPRPCEFRPLWPARNPPREPTHPVRRGRFHYTSVMRALGEHKAHAPC